MEEILDCATDPVLIMELLPLGSLREIFNETGEVIPRGIAVSIMTQLLHALNYLHKLDIIHGSIKFDNLLVFSEQPMCIKLTGFGFSTCGQMSLPYVTSVCPAPEVWEKYYRDRVSPCIWEKSLANQGYSEKRPRPLCGRPVDVWDTGIVCSQLTLGKVPCYLNNEKIRGRASRRLR